MSIHNPASRIPDKHAKKLPYRNDYHSEPDPEPVQADPVLQDDPNLAAEEQTWKGRYSELRSFSQKQLNAKDQEVANLQRQLEEATEEKVQLPKTEAELEVFAQEYPDVYKIMETLALKATSKEGEKLKRLKEQVESINSLTAQQKAERELLERHPDAFDLRDSEEFHTWVKTKSKHTQDVLYESGDIDAISEILDLYKLQTKGKKKPNTDGAAVVPSNRRSEPSNDPNDGTIRESWVAKLSSKEFEKHEDAINEARAKGKFHYDLSGGAR